MADASAATRWTYTVSNLSGLTVTAETADGPRTGIFHGIRDDGSISLLYYNDQVRAAYATLAHHAFCLLAAHAVRLAFSHWRIHSCHLVSCSATRRGSSSSSII